MWQVFSGAPELCLNVKDEDINKIFELIVETDDTLCQARLMDALDAVSKVRMTSDSDYQHV